MYRLGISAKTVAAIEKAGYKSPSVHSKLIALAEDPLGMAKATMMPIFCDYYVNAGRHCILFQVDEVEKIVHIVGIRLRIYVDKVLNNKIQPPQLGKVDV